MKRDELWLISLDPTIGAEIRKTRPAIMVNDDDIGVLPLRVVVPVTEWNDRFELNPWMVRLEPTAANGLSKLSAADTFQVRSVANQRFVRELGVVSDEDIRMIERALAVVLRL